MFEERCVEETINSIFESAYDYYLMITARDNFYKGVNELIRYRKRANNSEYACALYEAYLNADNESKRVMIDMGINNFTKFTTFITGYEMGVKYGIKK